MALRGALSNDKRNMNWRVIGWGIGLQLLIAAFIFHVPAGAKVFLVINDVVIKVLDSASAGSKINSLFNINTELSLKTIFGYIFYPFTIILGVPKSDWTVISKIIGERLIVTEVVAYNDLATALEQNLLQHPRSAVITTYALCGFAHLASMAIFVGGVCALAPDKSRNITGAAFRALIAATLACLMTACVAGVFFTEGSILFGK